MLLGYSKEYPHRKSIRYCVQAKVQQLVLTPVYYLRLMRGYWIPAKDVKANSNLCTLWDLVSVTSGPPVERHKRGLFDVSFYTSWTAYNPEGEPKYSSDFRKQQEEGEHFVKATKSLWKEASHYMEALCPGQFRELRRARLPKGIRRLASVWTGFAVNNGSDEAPVQTEPHRDHKSVFYEKSCLYPFGNFTGGGLILWDLRVVLELKAGDLFLFEDHLLTHSNEAVQGEQPSLVAFMHQTVLDWHNNQFGKCNKKRQKMKSDQELFRAKRSTRKKDAEKRKRRRGVREEKKQLHLKR